MRGGQRSGQSAIQGGQQSGAVSYAGRSSDQGRSAIWGRSVIQGGKRSGVVSDPGRSAIQGGQQSGAVSDLGRSAILLEFHCCTEEFAVTVIAAEI